MLDKILRRLDVADYYSRRLDTLVSTQSGWMAKCPFHREKYGNRTTLLIKRDGTYQCTGRGCPQRRGGSLLDFELAVGEHQTDLDAVQELADMAGINYEEVKIVDASLVDKLHSDLMQNEKALEQATELGISPAAITDNRLGWHEGRMVIPVPDGNGTDILDLRLVSLDDPSLPSATYLDYEPEARRYRLDRATGPSLVLFSSELEVLVAEELGVEDADVICGNVITSGVRATVSDRRVYDLSGLGRELYDRGAAVSLCSLSRSVFDLSHWRSNALRQAIVSSGKPLDAGTTLSEQAEATGFVDAYNAEHEDKLVKTKARVVGRTSRDFRVPVTMRVECTNNAGSKCNRCPLDGRREWEMPVDTETNIILRLVDKSDKHIMATVRQFADIPDDCNRYWINNKEFKNVYEIELVPDDLAKSDRQTVVRTSLLVGARVEDNRVYELTGKVMRHPDNQKIIGVWEEAVPVSDDIDNFALTPILYDQLKVFQPAWNEGVDDKLAHIAADMEQYVHGVGGRDAMQLVIDMTYHSVENFDFRGKPEDRGWVQALIIGDTAQAKTQMAEGLIKHYGFGEKISGDMATVAGLIGAVTPGKDKSWGLTWGAMPRNDRGFMLIDEVHKMTQEAFGFLNEVRSSGKAKITKSASGETPARVRLLLISNPKSRRKDSSEGNEMSSYNYGVEAIPVVLGANENVRRLDLALAVGMGEVDPEESSKERSLDEEGTYTSHLCNRLILWAWSRKPEHVEFTKEAEETIVEMSSTLSELYSPAIPLVVDVVQKSKLARLSAAIAARLFSTPDGEKLMVEREHALMAVNFLDMIYDNPIMGYRFFSDDRRSMEVISKDDIQILSAEIGKFEAYDLLVNFLLRNSSSFSMLDIRRETGYSVKQSKAVVGFLFANGLVTKTTNGNLRRNDRLVKLLRNISFGLRKRKRRFE